MDLTEYFHEITKTAFFYIWLDVILIVMEKLKYVKAIFHYFRQALALLAS